MRHRRWVGSQPAARFLFGASLVPGRLPLPGPWLSFRMRTFYISIIADIRTTPKNLPLGEINAALAQAADAGAGTFVDPNHPEWKTASRGFLSSQVRK